MKPSVSNSTKKSIKSKSELNNSITNFTLKNPPNSTTNSNGMDLETKIMKFEKIIGLLTSQNELIVKRMDDLESNVNKIQSNAFNRSIISTINTHFDDNDDGFFNPNPIKVNSEINQADIIEWKRDIELSLEKISERVAQNDCSAYLNLIEKKFNDLEEEFEEMKKFTKDFGEISESIRKNSDKCDKCEILVDEFIIQMSDLKSSSINWQTEFAKQNSDLTDKIMSHQFYIDQLQKFEKSITKKLENLNSELKKKENGDSELNEKNFKQKITKIEEINNKLPEFEDGIKLNRDLYNSINKTFKEEILKIDNNIKALWDSFALFSTSINP